MATINVTELASALDTTPREARKFLRTVTPADEQPGKGGRWAIEKREVRSLTKKFAAYREERASTPEVPANAIDDDASAESVDTSAE